ncbi:MAG: tRNA dihydrouridine synthase DusB [Deltaproteobacteria bacterium RBG_13_43_22]|nr:MAG: tRNA dihydrouridine synthase DusB [Deltaproteobacteria bacterium RBG_13_43_22]
MKIGSHFISFPYILAPMAGYTDLPFRLLVRRLGCELACTEMVSAEGLVRHISLTRAILKTVPEDHPLSIQLFGSNPEVMAQAALLAGEAGADIIDINMGCSVKKVVKSGSGAALLKDVKKTEGLIRAVRKATRLPLTIKIRSGWKEGELTYRTMAQVAEDLGVDALVIHPRYAVQGFSGQADWSIVTELKKRMRIPVIGSGDIDSPAQALDLKRQTGCDGIMIGRQALRTPWIFNQIREIEAGGPPVQPDLEDRRNWLLSYWKWIEENYQGPAQIKALRRTLFVLTRGLPASGEFRQNVALARTQERLRTLFEEYFDSLASLE